MLDDDEETCTNNNGQGGQIAGNLLEIKLLLLSLRLVRMHVEEDFAALSALRIASLTFPERPS